MFKLCGLGIRLMCMGGMKYRVYMCMNVLFSSATKRDTNRCVHFKRIHYSYINAADPLFVVSISD